MFFYSIPGLKVPSPYFKRFPKMMADISRKGILRFCLWEGSHEAPRPVEGSEADDTNIYKAVEQAHEGQGGRLPCSLVGRCIAEINKGGI
jgi:hypothetical protein